jgi:hypothetical protein
MISVSESFMQVSDAHLQVHRRNRHTTGIDWRKANGTKDHPVWASVPIATDPNKYDSDLGVLLALNPIKV